MTRKNGSLVLMQFWHHCNLDVSSFTAQSSAYNPNEHMWSPLNKNLTGVSLSAIDGADRTAYCRIGKKEKRGQGIR